tara:strand:- start:35614 stop:36975 length:1362 start_codon:yes stop_codon:yes gene_type:complete
MASAPEALKSARGAFESGRGEDGFGWLLKAWRSERSKALRDLVELAGEALAPPLQLAGRTQREQRADWVRRIRWKRPLELGGLLDGLDAPLKAQRPGQLVLLLDELLSTGCAEDPRVANWAMRILRHQRNSYGPVSSGFFKVNTRCLKLLKAAKDPFVIAELDLFAMSSFGEVKRCEKLATSLRKTLGAVPEPSEETQGLTSAVEALVFAAEPLTELREAGQEEGTLEQLRCAIFLDPDNESLCAVYSDLAQEEGLVHGEFVALQLELERTGSPKLQKLCEALIAKHWKAWLGPVSRYTSQSQIVFRHGFPYSLTTSVGRYLEVDAAFSGTELATLREIEFRGFGKVSLAMRNLRSATGVVEATLYDLCQQGHPTLEVLSLACPFVEYDDEISVDVSALQGQSKGRLALQGLDAKLLPKLHTLIFEDPVHPEARYGWVRELPIYGQLTLVQHP